MQAIRMVSFWIGCGAVLLASAGCGPSGVREDRSINYSRDGGGVAFQHGDEGVFVAGGDGERLEKIFDAADDTIAVSSPLWSPVDDRLIFTSAVSADPDADRSATNTIAWDANPRGRRFHQQDIFYTCLLRPAASDKEPGPPIELFQAKCNHPGYVAANLAVRWHPSGNRILFVDQTADGRHSLFEFDLETQEKSRIFDHSAAALIFDWSPGGSYLVCATYGDDAHPLAGCIWIRPHDEQGNDESGRWWQVPRSENLAGILLDAPLEQLRAMRPAWTADNAKFAFVASSGEGDSTEPDAHDEDAVSACADNIDITNRGDSEHRNSIFVVDAESRQTVELYQAAGRIRDLRWQPGTNNLGFVEESDTAALMIVDEMGAVLASFDDQRLRRFAGWNYDGSRLAYITPEPAPIEKNWALLFPRDPAARDNVYVASGAGAEPGRVVHQGMRITFPQWSPDNDTLSLWGTYAPSHRSWLSFVLPWTLRPGDPAAILDCRTGQMKWMAVNANEQTQVGHYYLLKRDYEQAWSWYEKSADEREPAGPIKLTEIDQFFRQQRIHQDSSFFEYYCLTKLGRHEEAAARLKRFRASMSFDTASVKEAFRRRGLRSEEVETEAAHLIEFVTPILQSAYIAEVFLSLDAAADGIAFFERELNAPETEERRLAAALCLSQL